MNLLAIRHPPVTVAGLCYGRHDVPVAPIDPDAVHRIAEGVADRQITVRTSPARRCLVLAERIAECCKVPLTVDDRLVELAFGAWEGRAWAEIERTDAEHLARFMASYHSVAPPGGETVRDLERRVGAFVEDARRDGPCLAVTHAGVIRALRVLLRGIPWDAALAEPVPYVETVAFELSHS